MYYKIDGGEEQEIPIDSVLINNESPTSATPTTITLSAGQKVEFYGNNPVNGNGSWNDHPVVKCTGACYVYGNFMSLVYKQNYATAVTLTGIYAFSKFFYGNEGLRNKSDEIICLPATTLTKNCYKQMFDGCSSITSAPALPATTMAENCYMSMFSRCSLTSAPVLPATTLAESCYEDMFYSCDFTDAPALPATTLAEDCYKEMFRRCASLSNAPTLPATTLANSCYEGMFIGCSSLQRAPDLPAPTLVNGCYCDMFQNCSSLNYIKCLATNMSASYCTKDWIFGVSSAGTFVKAAGANWDAITTEYYGIPSGWTVQTAP